MGDLPAVKLGFNLRQFAGVTGTGAYQWYYDGIRRTNPDTEGAFYNWGWWDFNFDELVYRTDFPHVEATPPEGGLRWFEGTGWVAIQTAMADPDNHIRFVTKSSPFGLISHSHGDQNAFCLAGFGEDLAIQSGYYVAFNSTMHQNRRRQTRSKNAILIDGKGQYAGRDKALAMKLAGRIELVEDRGDHVFVRGDATAAYATLSPEVTQVTPDVHFVTARISASSTPSTRRRPSRRHGCCTPTRRCRSAARRSAIRASARASTARSSGRRPARRR